MIILIGSEKGGVGKSTIATNLSALLMSQNKDVVLVDADRQSTSANWTQDRKSTGKVQVQCVRQYDDIENTIADLNKRYEYVIVDCQGRDSKELRTGLMVADKLIIPCRPSQPDLDTVPVMLNTIAMARRINSKLQVYCVLTMCPTNPKVNEVADSIAFLFRYPDLKLVGTHISDRKVYRDAISEGLSVVEKGDAKTSEEINGILNEVLNHG
jgi:chromosome partitioning protein